jgi:hypothetical protein
MNPHDGSSAHSNIALQFSGRACLDVLRYELDVVKWSARRNSAVLGSRRRLDGILERLERTASRANPRMDAPASDTTLQWLTEAAVRDRVIAMLGSTGAGDSVRIAMFYISERGVIEALKDAASAGADVRLILDLNRDAFGIRKTGVPNRAVAAELMAFAAERGLDLQVRWADTHGEQFHTKAIGIRNEATGRAELLCGSSNWTRRNLCDLNMEASVHVSGCPRLVARFAAYFDTAWTNGDGLSHTTSYGDFAETGTALRMKTFRYRLQEATGLGTF